MSIILSLFLIIGPIAIIYCGVKALKQTLIIRKNKKSKLSAALIASLWNVNGPDKRWNLK